MKTKNTHLPKAPTNKQTAKDGGRLTAENIYSLFIEAKKTLERSNAIEKDHHCSSCCPYC